MPATTVPADPNAPVSYSVASVSDWRMRIRLDSTPSSSTTIWVCTVEVPLPNSAVPTDSVKSPSESREIDASAKWPRGGMVAIIAMAMPSPIRHRAPSGAGVSPPSASAPWTRSRHWSRP